MFGRNGRRSSDCRATGQYPWPLTPNPPYSYPMVLTQVLAKTFRWQETKRTSRSSLTGALSPCYLQQSPTLDHAALGSSQAPHQLQVVCTCMARGRCGFPQDSPLGHSLLLSSTERTSSAVAECPQSPQGVFTFTAQRYLYLCEGQAGPGSSAPSHKGQKWSPTRWHYWSHVTCQVNRTIRLWTRLWTQGSFHGIPNPSASWIRRCWTFTDQDQELGQGSRTESTIYPCFLPEPNTGLEKGNNTLSAHFPKCWASLLREHRSRKTPCLGPPSLLSKAPAEHPQELGTWPPPSCQLCRELPKPWHCPGFTSPTCQAWGALAGSALLDREHLAWSKSSHGNCSAGQTQLPQAQKDDTQSAPEFVISQMPHKINGPLAITLI